MVTQSEIINKNFKQLQEENKVNNAYLTGQVSTEKKMFEQVKAMKTSTFDISKFITSGALTITEDGIASGFSFSPKILTKTAPVIDLSKPFRIELECKELTKNLGVFFSFGPDKKNYLYYRPTFIKLTLKEIDLTAQQNFTAVDYASIGKTVLTWDGSTYRAYVYKKDGTEYCNLSIASTTALTNAQIIIGESDWEGLGLTGSIDLKTVSIVSDGVEVFNGNKTGIDQIKKDDYEVVGSPVISDDGIASGFSSSNNILEIPTFAPNDKSWEISLSFIMGSSSGYLFACGKVSDSILRGIRLNVSPSSLELGLSYDGVTLGDTLSASHPLINGNKYNVSIRFTKGGYYQIWLDGVKIGQTSSTKSVIWNDTADKFYIGAIRVKNFYQEFFTGSIDLNSFKIYVDGNLVYQPTLRIPYTQSKTGSKIVNTIYRDRVQDMYEQFGQANYYTLSDTDVTLPMGEIYGMIENKLETSTTHIIKTFIDGTSGYRIWSDGYAEQWGYYSGVGAVVTFIKKFANTNYIVTNSINTTSSNSCMYSAMSHTDKTVSSVKFPNTGGVTNCSWRACGYLKEGEY